MDDASLRHKFSRGEAATFDYWDDETPSPSVDESSTSNNIFHGLPTNATWTEFQFHHVFSIIDVGILTEAGQRIESEPEIEDPKAEVRKWTALLNSASAKPVTQCGTSLTKSSGKKLVTTIPIDDGHKFSRGEAATFDWDDEITSTEDESMSNIFSGLPTNETAPTVDATPCTGSAHYRPTVEQYDREDR